MKDMSNFSSSDSVKKSILKNFNKAEDRAGTYTSTESVKSFADIIVVNEDGKILLLKRSKGEVFEPNKWALPGGTIEQGENDLACAVRELIEETSIEPTRENPLTYLTAFDNGGGSYTCYYFISLPKNDEVTLNFDEHEQYVWADKDILMNCDCILDLKERLMKLLSAWFTS